MVLGSLISGVNGRDLCLSSKRYGSKFGSTAWAWHGHGKKTGIIPRNLKMGGKYAILRYKTGLAWAAWDGDIRNTSLEIK